MVDVYLRQAFIRGNTVLGLPRRTFGSSSTSEIETSLRQLKFNCTTKMFSGNSADGESREGFLSRTRRDRDERERDSKKNDAAKAIQVCVY